MKKIAIIFIVLSILNLGIFNKEAISMDSLNGKKIVMIIASKNFRDEELQVPLAVFKEKGADVKIASSIIGTCVGKLGAKVKSDMFYSAINAKDFDAVVFVGGPGVFDYLNDPKAHKVAQDAAASGKILAAICVAPAIFANAGVLNGKNATVFPSDEDKDILLKGGANYTGAAVEVDGNIITADGPDSAKKFAEEIVKYLSK